MMAKHQSHDHDHGAHTHTHDHNHDHNHEGHTHDHAAHTHTHDSHEGHAHDHDQVNVRVHLHPEPETDSLSVEEHEGALVASLVQTADGSLAVVEADWAARLESLAAAVTSAGGTVGHIKASVTCGPFASVLSTIGSKAAVTRSKPTQCAIETAAIVFGLDEDTLREAVDHALL